MWISSKLDLRRRIPQSREMPLSQGWILPRWGKTPIIEMEPIVIEDWLSELGRVDSKLENGTRLKIRNIMSVVFRDGIRR
jgi:hypothetical protein